MTAGAVVGRHMQPAEAPPAVPGPALREPAPFSSEPKKLTLTELAARVDEMDELLGDLQALEEHYEKAARDAANACERFKFEAKKAERVLRAARQKSVDLCRHLRQMDIDATSRKLAKLQGQSGNAGAAVKEVGSR